ncbi:HrpE/YscL family type III secretion apparatus protein [Pseudomonas asturiensis]|uniref:HrpE/YscL family type III secretion apparatus protein n=1 Tax=Pseudomonas asturiensis TaxID=1190415 RepID=A0ABX6H9A0_9PSED|nr:type III secretion system stator protein SctL [Pseudomonas asturiensis]QHF02093.1 HrpE/YscL family type III secretion apparatus protein [Pseudomonas asturiensis]
MLAKRSIALTDTALLPEPIVRREHIADSLLARDVLADARREAQQLLLQAQEEGGRLQQQALAEFWATANAFLCDLHVMRDALQRQVMDSVESLLNDALSQLLDDTTLAERARAVVRNLAASQLNEAAATLSVHPDMAEPVAEWLAESRFAEHWRLKRDLSIAVGSLRLSDANGAFDIEWAALRDGLLGAETMA